MTRYYLADERFIRSPLKETAQTFGVKSKLDKMNNLHFKEKIVIIDFLLYGCYLIGDDGTYRGSFHYFPAVTISAFFRRKIFFCCLTL